MVIGERARRVLADVRAIMAASVPIEAVDICADSADFRPEISRLLHTAELHGLEWLVWQYEDAAAVPIDRMPASVLADLTADLEATIARQIRLEGIRTASRGRREGSSAAVVVEFPPRPPRGGVKPSGAAVQEPDLASRPCVIVGIAAVRPQMRHKGPGYSRLSGVFRAHPGLSLKDQINWHCTISTDAHRAQTGAVLYAAAVPPSSQQAFRSLK